MSVNLSLLIADWSWNILSLPVKMSTSLPKTLIGFGGLTDRYQRVVPYYGYGDEYGRLGGPDDTFFIVEPQLNIVWNMKTYLQIYFGGSYRYIRGIGIEGLDNANLNGYSVVVTFKFGRNAKPEPPDDSEFDGIDTF